MAYNFKSKVSNQAAYVDYMLAKSIPMFEWEGLPDSLPYRELEKMLQCSGYAFLAEHEGQIYAFNGGLGGEPDVYGNPSQIFIASPALKLNKTFNLEKDGVLISNDDLRLGLLPLYERFAFMQTETDINLTLYGYNTRINRLISASDDKTKESAELAVKRAIDGDIAIISENAIWEGISIHTGTSQNTGTAKSLIELAQFYRASLYNEIGLSANTNLKRERLVSAEVEQGEDSIFPLVLSMLKCRINAVEKINAFFGLEIKVDFGSVWKVKHAELIDDIVTDETGNGDGSGDGAKATITSPDPVEEDPEDKQEVLAFDKEPDPEISEEAPQVIEEDEKENKDA